MKKHSSNSDVDNDVVLKNLVRMNELYQHAERVSILGYWEWNISTDTVTWSDGLFRIFQLDPSEKAPSFADHASLLYPDDFQRLKNAIAVAVTEGTPYEIELRTIRKDGETRFCIVRGFAELEANEKVTKLCGTLQDITSLKQMNAMLNESQNLFQAVVEQISDTLSVLDYDGTFLLANSHAAKNICGGKPEDVIGRNIRDFVPSKSADQLIADYRQVIQSNAPLEREIEVILSGKTLWFYNRLLPLTYGENQKKTVLSVSLDVTERKQSEQAIQNMQKLESLGVLAGGIAHDFNNLLSGIYGYIDMTMDLVKDEKALRNLSKIIASIDRARALTNQFLTFAKGGAPLQKIGYLFPFVEEAVKFALSGSSVSIHFDTAEGLWPVNYDKNQIGQVIDNIIINAQQAMPAGGTIDLSARNVTLAEKEHPLLAKGDYVRLSIRDSGTGIPKELLNRIFDPFFTTKSHGHGLGLATCYSIISQHNGCIDVQSEIGKGSTFIVYLPATDAAVHSANAESTTMHKGTGVFLVMDDEEVIRNTVKEMLESFGYSVVCKETPGEAIDFYRENPKIVGIIFDLTVPGTTGGKDAAVKICTQTTNVPVFVASGYSNDPVMKYPSQYGFTASICKPFLRTELSQMLSKHLT